MHQNRKLKGGTQELLISDLKERHSKCQILRIGRIISLINLLCNSLKLIH